MQRIRPRKKAASILSKEMEYNEDEALEIKFISQYKGFGVFARRFLMAGEYLAEYKGEMISEEEGTARLKTNGPSYIYFFEHRKQTLCIDGEISGGVASFINDDDKRPNARTEKIIVNGKPHLAIFVRNEGGIQEGEEVTYNYGQNKELMFWREGNPNPCPYADPALVHQHTLILDPGKSDILANILAENPTDTERSEPPFIFDPKGREETVSSEDMVNLFRINAERINAIEAKFEVQTNNMNAKFAALQETTNTLKVLLETVLLGKMSAAAPQHHQHRTVENQLPVDLDSQTPLIGSQDHYQTQAVDGLPKDIEESQTATNPQEEISSVDNLPEEIEGSHSPTEPQDLQLSSVADSEINAPTNPQQKDAPIGSQDHYQNQVVDSLPQDIKDCQSATNPQEEISSVDNLPEEIVGSHLPTELQDLQLSSVADNEINAPTNPQQKDAPIGSQDHYQNQVVDSLPQDIEDCQSATNPQEEISSVDNLPEEIEGTHSPTGPQDPQPSSVADSEINAPTNPQQSSRKKSKFPRPLRPCIYCKKLDAKLTRHLKSKHRDEDEVKEALLLPPKQQNKKFEEIKRRGIYEHNIDMLQKDKRIPLMRERKQRKSNGTVLCKTCHGFFGQKYFYNHAKTCKKEKPVKIFTIQPTRSNGFMAPENFQEQILDKLRNRTEKVTKFCLSNDIILKVGMNSYDAILVHPDKVVPIRRRVMALMRLLGRLLLAFIEEGRKDRMKLKPEDVFDIANFIYFEKAIKLVSVKSDHQHASVRLHSQAACKALTDTMLYYYMIERNDVLKKKVEEFQVVLRGRSKNLFGKALFDVRKERSETLRRPCLLPVESDVEMLQNYISVEIANLDNLQTWNKSQYIHARRLCVCGLTFLNARRSGEPSRLTLTDVKDAIDGNWLDKTKIGNITDPLEKKLIDHNHIAYQMGKGSRQLVSVIIPDVFIKTIMKLCSESVRNEMGIDCHNIYAFPSTGGSSDPTSGWHDSSDICKMAGLSQDLTADKMRHRAATLFAALNVPEDERTMFYEHVGHSKDIDLNVYASPKSIGTVTKVGKRLHSFFSIAPSTCEQQQADNVHDSLMEEIHEEAVVSTEETHGSLSSLPFDPLVEAGTSRSSSSETPPTTKSKRGYTTWIAEEAQLVFNEFQCFIKDPSPDNKGPLPGVGLIREFLKRNPSFLSNSSTPAKIKLVKNKVMNERKKLRNSLHLFM